ncbi:unnamed protein product [Arabidopsis halleri]
MDSRLTRLVGLCGCGGSRDGERWVSCFVWWLTAEP